MTAVAYHESLAPGWDSRYNSGSFRRRLVFIANHVLQAGLYGRWLDVGCGSGTFSRMLAERGVTSVVGVDASAGMIAEARDRSARERLGDRCDFDVIETAERLPFADASFDGAICFSVVEYLPQPETALRELARVLKPGARVIVSIPHARSVLRWLQSLMVMLQLRPMSPGLAYIDISRFTLHPANAESYFARCGLRLVRRQGFDQVIPQILCRLLAPSLVFYDLTREEK